MVELIKRAFYSIYPTSHISSLLRTIYLQKYLRQFQFNEVLDAGCGPGQFSFYVAKQYPDAQVTGYDLSDRDIRKCQDKQKELGIDNVKFQRLDLFKLNEEECYDLIYTIDVLEHIPGNLEIIKKLDAALKEGGILYIAMPNEKNHSYVLPDKFFKKYMEWSSKEHIGDQYYVEALASILKGFGYEIHHARNTFGLWGKLAWELDMMMENYRNLKRISLPFLLIMCFLDTLWNNKDDSYALLIICEKKVQRKY